MKTKWTNELKMLLFTALLGAFVGVVLWCFLKAVGIVSAFFWDTLPEKTGMTFLSVPLCAAGGLVLGILHKIGGDYPDELTVVMDKIKKDKHYDYKPMIFILLCAFLPLVLGASVGPEAGLTGIIAGLCYWIGDNVKYAKQHETAYSRIGEAVMLGELFHMPLFGIIAVEENEEDRDGFDTGISKGSKFLLYGIAAAAGYLTVLALNNLLGAASEGFPMFEMEKAGGTDFALMLLYIPVGVLLCLFFQGAEKLSERAALKVPCILRETLCGLLVGIVMLFAPMALFSGEEEMRVFMTDYGTYAPLFMIGICFLKLFMTAFCIRFGLKGGHFFPVIFSCVLMGFAIAALIFQGADGHGIFAAGIITAAALGAQLKKPAAASALLLLCFPVRMILWLFIAAAVGSRITQAAAAKKTER
ncbi:MAG: chloride channel protein [Lachnospiraceae bacterium]|nr:chloride channel protein [Lachnospiraceae bacterium]